MKSIIKISKLGIIAILTLCMLLGVAGTCLNVTAMAAETTATVEAITVVTEASAIATEETTAISEEIAPELMPMMASACWGTLDEALNYYIGKNDWSYGANGSPQADGFDIYVNMSTGYCRVTGNDVNYSFYFG